MFLASSSEGILGIPRLLNVSDISYVTVSPVKDKSFPNQAGSKVNVSGSEVVERVRVACFRYYGVTNEAFQSQGHVDEGKEILMMEQSDFASSGENFS